MLKIFLDYIKLGGLLLIGISALYLPIFFIVRKEVAILRQLSVLLLAGCTFILLFATILMGLRPGMLISSERFLNLIPLYWLFHSWEMGNTRMYSQIISNILIFVPIGFLYPVVFKRLRRFWRTLAFVFLFSFAIEFLQYFIGRSADIDDLLQNTTGGIAGYAVYTSFSHVFGKKQWWDTALGNMRKKYKEPYNSINVI